MREREREREMSSRGSGLVVKCCLVAFAVASALFVSWPAISWSFRKRIKQGTGIAPSCGPCVCDCPPPLSLLSAAPDTTSSANVTSSNGTSSANVTRGVKTTKNPRVR